MANVIYSLMMERDALKEELKECKSELYYSKKSYERLKDKYHTIKTHKYNLQKSNGSLREQLKELEPAEQHTNECNKSRIQWQKQVQILEKDISQLQTGYDILERQARELAAEVRSIAKKRHEDTQQLSQEIEDLREDRNEWERKAEAQERALHTQTAKKDKILLQRDKARTLVQDIYDHVVSSEDPIPWDEICKNHDWFNQLFYE